MEEITVNRHSFHQAVENVDKAIKKRPEDLAELPSFKESALYLFDHNVTGKEMNSFVEVLQGTLIDSNIIIEGALNEIKGIYTALDKLDKDYIDGIILALKNAKKAIDKAETSLSKVKTNSEQNTKTLQALKLTVDHFKEFKNEVNKVLPLIPAHTETLNEVSRVVERSSSSIAALEKRMAEDKKQSDGEVAKALDAVKKTLTFDIAKAQREAEDKASKELASATESIKKEMTIVPQLKRRLLFAYVVGALGLLTSVVTLLLSILHLI